MSSSPVDKGTMQNSSVAAQQNSATAAANSGTASGNSNAAYAQLMKNIGSYANPSSLNQTGLNSTYKNIYNTTANQTAATAQNAVASSQRQAVAQGQGATPTGYRANQAREAYQTQAGTNAATYAGLGQQQLSDSINQFQNANNLVSQYGQGQGQLGLGYQQNASGTNTSLYGTSSQQKQSPWGAVLGAAAGVGGAAITKYCWIAEAIYGVDAPETFILRRYLSGPFRDGFIGRVLMNLYGRFGKGIASLVRRSIVAKAILRPVFDCALTCALRHYERGFA